MALLYGYKQIFTKYMVWILALILLAGIVLLYKREMKKRMEWQLEYRYLTRHKKNGAVGSVDTDLVTAVDGAVPKSIEKVSPPVSVESKSKPKPKPKLVNTSVGEDMAIAMVEEVPQTGPKWKKWSQQMGFHLREIRPTPFRRSQDLFALVQDAMYKGPHAKKAVAPESADNSSVTSETIQPIVFTTETIAPMSAPHPSKTSRTDDLHLQAAANVHTQTIEVPDLNELVFNAAHTEEAQLKNGYALTDVQNDWEEDERWLDDQGVDGMRQEITLDEINWRRDRLREYSENVVPVSMPVVDAPHNEVIVAEDVAHVIRHIKEESYPEPTPHMEVIAEEAVLHVIAAIKGDVKVAQMPLEVIELPEKMPKSPAQPANLEVIGLDDIQCHRQMQAKAHQFTNAQLAKSKASLETIELPESGYVPKVVAAKAEQSVIEFPHATVKQVTPKAEPSLQTIVMTEQGLQMVKAAAVVAGARPGRAAADTALLSAMVQSNEQAMIADNDIRANLLRQRMARRRAPEAAAVEGLVSNSVIAEEEVFANLAKTDSPVNRQPRAFKPRPMVRDSVIPSTARVGGEHGFKVKQPNMAATTAAVPTPISSRFTPFSHPELQNQTNTVTGRLNGDEVSAPLAETNETIVGQAMVRPNVITPAPDNTLYRPHVPKKNLHTKPQGAWAQAVGQPIKPIVRTKQVNAIEVEVAVKKSAPEAVAVRQSIVAEPVRQPQMAPAVKAAVVEHESDGWLPSLMLLNPAVDDSSLRPNEEVLLGNGIIIEEKLAEFKVNVAVTDAYAGPVITRYEIEPATGVRGSQVVNLEKDLARSLGFASIRVVETIPGKTCMGLELPNPKRQIIRLSSVLQSAAFQESKSKLTLVLGQDISGNPVVTDLGKAPHLLVAGTTGSGKSVGVNAMILSLLYKATPEEVRMIMIDPKMLELSVYEGIPHLLAPVVTDMRLAANALNWCVNEMEKRYRLMSHLGVRNVAGYNQKIAEAQAQGQRIANPFSLTPETPELLEKLPFIVVVVDEFADLMMTAGKKIEELIARLAQKARAAGIHLILATQRPSVDVITGLIKANIPTRIAFQVSSKIDSRTILDQMGAENLLGQGDMLFLPPGTGYPRRVHGAFVADDEVHNVVEYLKQFGEPDYVEDLLIHGMDDSVSTDAGNSRQTEEDPLYDQAVGFVISSGKTSISAVQRQMRIGYNRAARLVEQMEVAGVLSAPEHNGNRTLLVPQQVQ